MADRTPPNKGLVEFPSVFHMRITQEMKQAILSRGGASWLRSLVAANTRVPENVEPTSLPLVSPSIASDTPAKSPRGKRGTGDTSPKKGKPRRRVSLDKRKGRAVK